MKILGLHEHNSKDSELQTTAGEFVIPELAVYKQL